MQKSSSKTAELLLNFFSVNTLGCLADTINNREKLKKEEEGRKKCFIIISGKCKRVIRPALSFAAHFVCLSFFPLLHCTVLSSISVAMSETSTVPGWVPEYPSDLWLHNDQQTGNNREATNL